MKISDAIIIVKEFFLEILGFVTPGFILLFVTYSLLSIEYKNHINTIVIFDNTKDVVILIFSYVTGYIIFGVSNVWHNYKKNRKASKILQFLKEKKVIKEKKAPKTVEDTISASFAYKRTKEILIKNIEIDEDVINKMNVRDLRNIAMSFVPEADDKIYTFMFRSVLSDTVSFVFRLIGAFGILSFVGKWICLKSHVCLFSYSFLRSDSAEFFIIYLSFFLIALFLTKTQERFYQIALKIVFPIFIAKYNLGKISNFGND